jgi:uncharacterized membrane protein YkoI
MDIEIAASDLLCAAALSVMTWIYSGVNMNHKTIRKSASRGRMMALLVLGITVTATNAFAYSGQKLAREAKINMEQAREIALRAYPGKITDEELEREKGGSGLRYSFDIRHSKVTQEVGVDAKTGEVLENDPEGPNPD